MKTFAKAVILGSSINIALYYIISYPLYVFSYLNIRSGTGLGHNTTIRLLFKDPVFLTGTFIIKFFVEVTTSSIVASLKPQRPMVGAFAASFLAIVFTRVLQGNVISFWFSPLILVRVAIAVPLGHLLYNRFFKLKTMGHVPPIANP